ncbi:MAG: DUF4159 domain-containing protein [bacterium]|nr:DUF4159 domain-containing protein [bacterium]
MAKSRYTSPALIALIVVAAAVSGLGQISGRRFPTGEGYSEDQFHKHPSAIKVARLHYSGGGDWYWGNSAIPNFLKFVRDNTDYPVDTLERQVKIMDADLFQYPYLFATGHGVISFSAEQKGRLRQYLLAGGFLFVNDSYGMDKTFREEMGGLFPERQVVELPFDHPIYHSFYDFSNGPPKIHEHDELPPRGYAIIIEDRVVLYFLVESDIGDGWEDAQVHNDPPEKRRQALEMGLNILTYALLY